MNENVSFTDYTFGIRLPDCTKLAIKWKNVNDVTILRHGVIVIFFDVVLIFLSRLVIIIGSGAMTISFNKRLIRNPEIENTPVWVVSNIWKLGGVRNNEFGMNLSNKMLWNAEKSQSYNFYRFWVIKWKLTERVKYLSPNLRLGLKHCVFVVPICKTTVITFAWEPIRVSGFVKNKSQSRLLTNLLKLKRL